MNIKAYEAVCRISDDEWRNIAVDLTRHALSVSRRLRWRTRNVRDLPGGETVESIPSKAIEKLFSGERDWDPENEPDITKYLMSVIDSLLNHLAESHENTLMTIPPEPDSIDGPAWESGSSKRDPASDWLVPATRSPENLLIEQEQTSLEDRALELLMDECGGDEVLMKVLENMMDGYKTSAEISEAMGIPVKDVYNATKRLDRKLESVRKCIADEQNAAVAERKRV